MKKPKTLSERLTPSLLAKLKSRKLSNAEVAQKLGVSETYLSRTVAAIQDKDPGVTAAQRAAAHELYKMRRKVRMDLAKRVIAKRNPLTLEEAAKQANCSRRTMFRYVAQVRG